MGIRDCGHRRCRTRRGGTCDTSPPGTGMRADAVDAGVGPEVDQHHVTAQPGERQRLVARRVEPHLVAGELGRGALVGQLRSGSRLRVAGLLARSPLAPDARPGCRRSPSSARCGSPGRSSAEGRLLAIELSKRTSRLAAITTATASITAPIAIWMRPRYARRRSEILPAPEHQRVEHNSGSDGVGEGDREAAERERLRRRDRDDAGQDRAGAGRIDEARGCRPRAGRPRSPRLRRERGPEPRVRSRPRGGRPPAGSGG